MSTESYNEKVLDSRMMQVQFDLKVLREQTEGAEVSESNEGDSMLFSGLGKRRGNEDRLSIDKVERAIKYSSLQL